MVPSFLHCLVYLCHLPGLVSYLYTLAHKKFQSPTKQNIETNALSTHQGSPQFRLLNDFYFMPLWQSHPIRLKYPGLERFSPESFSKGASHRPLNPPHFMVPIFNSSERDSGGEWGKQLQIRVAAPHTIEVLDVISAGLQGSLSHPSDRH